MTVRQHIRMTASEIAMRRYMRAPDHPAADEFAAAFDGLAQNDDPSKPEPVVQPPAADDGDGKDGGAAAAGDGADAGDGGDGKEAAAAAGADGGDGKEAAAAAAGEGNDKAAEGGDGKDGGAAAAGAQGGDKKDPPAAVAPDADDVLKRLASMVKDAPAQDKPAAEQPKEEEKPLFTADEEQQIEHFRKEWPEVAAAFDLQMRGAAHAILKHAFAEIGKEFGPLKEIVDELSARTHVADIQKKTGGYTNEEVDGVKAWVAEQPTYLQEAMQRVISEGTADEVADLVSRYREAKGIKPAGAPVSDPKPSGGDAELSTEAKQAAAGLAPVSTKRSVITPPDDKSDFDGAFSRFADSL